MNLFDKAIPLEIALKRNAEALRKLMSTQEHEVTPEEDEAWKVLSDQLPPPTTDVAMQK